METVAHGLLLAGGWSLLLTQARWRDLGLRLLVLSAISRPEAHVHVAASVLLMAGWSQSETWRRIIGVAAVLGAFHALRFWWLGRSCRTRSSRREAWDRPSRGRAGWLSISCWWPPRWFSWPRCFGLSAGGSSHAAGLQAFVVGLGPLDWMGAGRLVLPGAMATIAVLVAFVRPQHDAASGRCCSCPWRRWDCYWSPVSCPVRTVRPSRFSGSATGLHRRAWRIETPFIRDVAFLAGEIPSGGHIYTGDVGIVGHLPELQVWDTAGLIDRAVAEHRASGVAVSAELEARVDGTADSAVCYKQRALETPAAIREDLPGYRIRMAFMKGAVATAGLPRH